MPEETASGFSGTRLQRPAGHEGDQLIHGDKRIFSYCSPMTTGSIPRDSGRQRKFWRQSGLYGIAAPINEYSRAERNPSGESSGRIRPWSREGNYKVFVVEGPPVRCIHLGLLEMLPRRPDLVVSGINLSSNVGIDITRSENNRSRHRSGRLRNPFSDRTHWKQSSTEQHLFRKTGTMEPRPSSAACLPECC